jgi:hypothetical protein
MPLQRHFHTLVLVMVGAFGNSISAASETASSTPESDKIVVAGEKLTFTQYSDGSTEYTF